MHPECAHEVIEQTADGGPQYDVHGVKGDSIVVREEFQKDTGVEIESGRLHVQVVQTFKQPVAQQLRVEYLEKLQQGSRVKANSQAVINDARSGEKQQQQQVRQGQLGWSPSRTRMKPC